MKHAIKTYCKRKHVIVLQYQLKSLVVVFFVQESRQLVFLCFFCLLEVENGLEPTEAK